MDTKKYSLYKNGIHLHDFDTMTDCSKWPRQYYRRLFISRSEQN